MINWTSNKYPDTDQVSLLDNGYTIENAIIKSVNLSMADHGVMTMDIVLEGSGWGCVYGGYVIGKGYVGSYKFEGSAVGIEYIMRIMDVVGVSYFNDMNGKYIRVALKSWGDSIKIIGNILDDKWFDTESFFKDNDKNIGE